MSEHVIAKRYADALFQLGDEKNILEDYESDLKIVHDVFSSDEQIITFLKHPSVSDEAKLKIVSKAFEELHIDILNTLRILIERNRIEMVLSIVDRFVHLMNEKKGIAEAKVYSVRELSEQEQDQLKLTFAKRFNVREVHLTNIVDPTILGGITVQVGNTIYDGSVKSKLKRIERNIVTANN